MLARKWQLPGSDISNTVVKELKFSILQTGYQQNPGTQVNYEKPQEIGSNCHKEPALTFLSKVVSAFRYHQRRQDSLSTAIPDQLTANGYQAVSQNGQTFYFNASTGEIVDLANRLVFYAGKAPSSHLARTMRAAPRAEEDSWAQTYEKVNTTRGYVEEAILLYSGMLECTDARIEQLKTAIDEAANQESVANKYLEKYNQAVNIYESSGGTVKLKDGTVLVIEKSERLKPVDFSVVAREMLEKAQVEIQALKAELKSTLKFGKFLAAYDEDFQLSVVISLPLARDLAVHLEFFLIVAQHRHRCLIVLRVNLMSLS